MSASDSPAAVADRFTAYYLQRATAELAEDLDRVRTADDFRPGSVPVLVNALRQGAAAFSPAEQERVVTAKAPGVSSEDGADRQKEEDEEEEAPGGAEDTDVEEQSMPKKEKEKKKKESSGPKKDKSKKKEKAKKSKS